MVRATPLGVTVGATGWADPSTGADTELTLMVTGDWATVTVRTTGGAASKDSVPGCVAVTVHSPACTNESCPLLHVQAPDVEMVTFRPDVATVVIRNGAPPKTTGFNVGNEIVCGCALTRESVTPGSDSPIAFVAITLTAYVSPAGTPLITQLNVGPTSESGEHVVPLTEAVYDVMGL